MADLGDPAGAQSAKFVDPINGDHDSCPVEALVAHPLPETGMTVERLTRCEPLDRRKTLGHLKFPHDR
jgi:hypothetical protein|uniref:Uncharacterized protein n=1 Tax=uncultured prokaryote TaxID=198431 RepID=A0A0H5Q3C3_9ZZZZ|nr:hypothetical protein [uncultured prokaryote]